MIPLNKGYKIIRNYLKSLGGGGNIYFRSNITSEVKEMNTNINTEKPAVSTGKLNTKLNTKKTSHLFSRPLSFLSLNNNRISSSPSSSLSSSSAFAMLEISIMMLIIGFMMSSFISSMPIKINNENNITTKKKLKAIERMIDYYISVNDKLPCPASIKLIITDPDYGVENCDYSNIVSGSVDSGDGGKGGGNDTGIRYVVYDSSKYSGSGGGSKEGNVAIVGAVPTEALGLQSTYSYDGWGSKFVYVVPVGYTENRGSFLSNISEKKKTLNNNNDVSRSPVKLINGRYIYAVISPGKNRGFSYFYKSSDVRHANVNYSGDGKGSGSSTGDIGPRVMEDDKRNSYNYMESRSNITGNGTINIVVEGNGNNVVGNDTVGSIGYNNSIENYVNVGNGVSIEYSSYGGSRGVNGTDSIKCNTSDYDNCEGDNNGSIASDNNYSNSIHFDDIMLLKKGETTLKRMNIDDQICYSNNLNEIIINNGCDDPRTIPIDIEEGNESKHPSDGVYKLGYMQRVYGDIMDTGEEKEMDGVIKVKTKQCIVECRKYGEFKFYVIERWRNK
jgi:type II secretory pathway pseudopilin PulG